MLRKKLMVPLLAITVGGAALLAVTQVHAQSGSESAGLVQMIAQKFNLDSSQVQTVVDQFRQDHKGDMHQRMQDKEENHLTQLVTDGKLTEAQKQAILNELAALKTKYNPDNLKNLSQDDRKKQMQAMHDELKSWLQSQGIDPNILMGFGKGMVMRRGWFKPTPSASP